MPRGPSVYGVSLLTTTTPSAFARDLSACIRCGETRSLRDEPRLQPSRLPLWLRSAFRRLQLSRRPVRTEAKPAEARQVDDLAVVCCYFNPLGYRSRRDNYQRFAQQLSWSKVHLLTVELAIGEQDHDLPVEYGDVLRVRSQSMLWHKERLLNLGIERLLEEGFQRIVWLDADVRFQPARSWPQQVASALDRSPLCQVFSDLVADTGPREVPAISAVRYHSLTGDFIDQPSRAPRWGALFGTPMGMPGYGWAATAELLAQQTLYDHAVVGGADKIMFAAAVVEEFQADRLVEFLASPFQDCSRCGCKSGPSDAMVDGLVRWARGWRQALSAQPTVADLSLEAMWHGSWTNRAYWQRQELLSKYSFDPQVDVVLNEDGCWEWGSDKPELHRRVAQYFGARQEDTR